MAENNEYNGQQGNNNQPNYDQQQYNQPNYNQPNYDQQQYNQPNYNQQQYNQPNYNQPNYNQQQYNQQGAPQQEQKGLSIASMVLGIVSIVLFCLPWLGIPCGVIGLILGCVALGKKKPGKGMAVAGVVCSLIGLIVLITIVIIGVSAGTAGMFEALNNL